MVNLGHSLRGYSHPHQMIRLSQYPLILKDCDLEILEKFMVLMHNRSGTAVSVDEARLDMLAR